LCDDFGVFNWVLEKSVVVFVDVIDVDVFGFVDDEFEVVV